jgi:hypothetical protein
VKIIRKIPHIGPLVRELWLHSRYGGLRYILVEDDGITETSGNGETVAPAEEPEDAGSLIKI